MTQSAHVHSIDLIKHLHAVLARFGVTGQECLGMADREIHHLHDTLADQLRHWRQQANKCAEDVTRARAALSHARAGNDGKPFGCVEQELDLRKAQERLRYAEEKVQTVQRWQRQLPEVTKEYLGKARALSGYLDSDLRQALALLTNKITAIEAYLAISVGRDAPPPPKPAEAPKEEQP